MLEISNCVHIFLLIHQISFPEKSDSNNTIVNQCISGVLVIGWNCFFNPAKKYNLYYLNIILSGFHTESLASLETIKILGPFVCKGTWKQVHRWVNVQRRDRRRRRGSAAWPGRWSSHWWSSWARGGGCGWCSWWCWEPASCQWTRPDPRSCPPWCRWPKWGHWLGLHHRNLGWMWWGSQRHRQKWSQSSEILSSNLMYF